MEFVLGMIFGAAAMAAAVMVSIAYDPYGKITEYRLMLGLEEDEEKEGEDDENE